MDFTKIYNQTAAIRATNESREDIEFKNSQLHKYINNQIYKAAAKGKNNVCLGFYTIKEYVLGDKYGGPTIDAVIRHFSNEGFGAEIELSEDEETIYIYWTEEIKDLNDELKDLNDELKHLNALKNALNAPRKHHIDPVDVIIALFFGVPFVIMSIISWLFYAPDIFNTLRLMSV